MQSMHKKNLFMGTNTIFFPSVSICKLAYNPCVLRGSLHSMQNSSLRLWVLSRDTVNSSIGSHWMESVRKTMATLLVFVNLCIKETVFLCRSGPRLSEITSHFVGGGGVTCMWKRWQNSVAGGGGLENHLQFSCVPPQELLSEIWPCIVPPYNEMRSPHLIGTCILMNLFLKSVF